MRLHGIEIPVVDIDRAFRFYADVLEFPVVGRFGEGSATFFLGDVHGGMVSLFTAPVIPDGGGPRLLLSADGGVDDTRARLEGKGVTFLGPTGHDGSGPMARFLDSEGNQLALFDHQFAARFRDQAREPNDALSARLREMEARVFAAIDDLDAVQAAHRPAPDEWPVLGHLAHMIDTLDSCGIVAADLAAGRQPPRDRLLQKEYEVGTFADMRAALQASFGNALQWLPGLAPAGGTAAMLPHGVFGPLSHREWVAFMLFHLGMHVNQIQAITAAPGFPTARA